MRACALVVALAMLPATAAQAADEVSTTDRLPGPAGGRGR